MIFYCYSDKIKTASRMDSKEISKFVSKMISKPNKPGDMNYEITDLTCEEAFAKYPSLSAKHYKELYQALSEKQRKEFDSLSVDRQIGLLCVPVRQQASYKKSGISGYFNNKPAARTNNRMTKDGRYVEKHVAKYIVNNDKMSLY